MDDPIAYQTVAALGKDNLELRIENGKWKTRTDLFIIRLKVLLVRGEEVM